MKNNKSSFAKKIAKLSLGLAACAAVTVTAYAAVIFDAETGKGFVGKGDVQLIYGWNNKGLQDNAEVVKFRYSLGTTTTETTWTCDRNDGPQTQERSNTVTKSTLGLVSFVARERNQITGFNLTAYDGGLNETILSHEGPKTESCPTGWTAIDVVVTTTPPTEGGNGLEVSIDGTNWFSLQ